MRGGVQSSRQPLIDYKPARVGRQTADGSAPGGTATSASGPATVADQVHKRSGAVHHCRSIAPALGRAAAGSPCASRARFVPARGRSSPAGLRTIFQGEPSGLPSKLLSLTTRLGYISRSWKSFWLLPSGDFIRIRTGSRYLRSRLTNAMLKLSLSSGSLGLMLTP